MQPRSGPTHNTATPPGVPAAGPPEPTVRPRARRGAARNRAILATVSGRLVDLVDPDPASIDVGDIAHNLGRICRFGGGVAPLFSVADHALHCRELMLAHGDPQLAEAALHHDDHEAYLGDLVTPLKRRIGPAYERLTRRMDTAIGEALGIDPELFRHPLVVDVDRAAGHLEAEALDYRGPLEAPPPRWIPLERCALNPLRDAAGAFLTHHRALTAAHRRPTTDTRSAA